MVLGVPSFYFIHVQIMQDDHDALFCPFSPLLSLLSSFSLLALSYRFASLTVIATKSCQATVNIGLPFHKLEFLFEVSKVKSFSWYNPRLILYML